MVREIYMKAAHTARPARGSFQNTQRRSSSVRRTNKSNRSSDEQSTTLRHNVVFRTCVLLQRWKQKKRQKSGLTVPSSIAAASSSMDNYNVGATLNGSNKESHLQRPLLSSVQCNNCSIENAKLPIGRHSQEERGIENGQLGQQSNGHDQPDTNNNDNGDALARSDVGRIEKANLKDRTDRDSLANKSSNVVQDADQDGAKEEAKEAPGQSSSTAPIGPVTHMHSQCSSSATSRKSVLVSLRAASFLLPLYGLHYLVFAYRLDTT